MDLGHFRLGYIMIMEKSWDTGHRVLTTPILEDSKIGLTGLIYLILLDYSSPTNSDLATNLQPDFEGSRASKYLESPNLALKEHYVPKPHCNLS